MAKQKTNDEAKLLEKFANIEILEKQGAKVARLTLDSTTFPLKVILSAVYSDIEKAGFMVDFSDGKFVVEIIKTNSSSKELMEISKDFQNRLINHAFYELQTMRTDPLKKLLLQAVDFPYDYAERIHEKEKSEEQVSEVNAEADEAELENALGVEELEIPWSEKKEDDKK
ncbi:MAG TPA: hypothetical protein ENN46_01655 [Candidatus Woesearchaeota archaeon]|nr:hypothetical protein [Candidatus Woesearchaeota archaeon]